MGSPFISVGFTDFTEGFMTEGNKDGDRFVRTSVITTPVKFSGLAQSVDEIEIESNKDETPIKNHLLLKRPLMRDMSWGDKAEETKHSMEMRSRKCRNLKNKYYDRQEYSDYGEDLSFLFEDDLPELAFRPRRKPRKKRPTLVTKELDDEECSGLDWSNDSTSFENNAKDISTSPVDTFCKTRLSMDNTFPETGGLRKQHSLEDQTELESIFKSIKDTKTASNGSISTKQPLKRQSSASINSFLATKRRKCEEKSAGQKTDVMISSLGEKWSNKSSKTLVISLEKSLGVERHLRLNCNGGKFNSTDRINRKVKKSPNLEKRESVVTRMMLRRRHSTPSSLGGAMLPVEDSLEMPRTVSTPVNEPRRGEVPTKEEKPQKSEGVDEWQDEMDFHDEIFDSERFVDSPDSGFSSETSCNAVTPDVESVGSMIFNPAKSDEPLGGIGAKQPVSRTTSKDSGVQLNSEKTTTKKPEKEELRLNLCQKSILEAQRLEREAKQKKEEEMRREKYQCRWVDCANPFENRCGADLHSHLEKYHSENYCCKWVGCKFFEIASRKISFLQRHIAEHSGEKPYKCILDGCGASFSSILSRKRHVESHYSEVTLPKAKIGGDHGGLPRCLLNSRKIKNERKTLANRHDCMDGRTMSFIRGALIQSEVATGTEDEIQSGISEITFQAEVVGERVGRNGRTSRLVHWRPENLVPDEWIKETEFKTEKKLKKAELPWNTKESLKRLLLFRRIGSGRKTPRKASVLDSIF